jgi:GNAT superfamily N-acetyltransferase
MPSPHDTLNLPQALGDGLVLRLATPADADALAEFNTRVLREEDDPPQCVDIWTRDLMSGRHPTTTAADFVVVEDTKIAKIVSSICLIPQTWAYEGIPFPVGRPELVGTDPAYRRRGLARAIFGKIHALSAAYGHLVQGITGIPWFYRQFGYEFALPLGGARDLHVSDVSPLKEGETEPYQIRQATEEDLPTIIHLYQRQCADRLVTTLIDEDRWRYDLSGHSKGSDQELRVYCILNREGRVVGYFSTSVHLWGSRLGVWEMAVEQGIPLRSTLPSVARALKTQGEAYAEREKRTLTAICFTLGLEHPAYDALGSKLGPFQRPYGWYIRVPDLPGFVRHVAPVLERRLLASVMSGFSGELKITFYRGGLRLVFEGGKLIDATDWQAPETNVQWEGAGFPPLVFLQLLFGYRSLEELRYAFPDCWADDEPRLLLNALFPKRASWVIPLG